MAGRADVVERIAELVGEDVLRITELGTGWPASCILDLGGRTARVAVYGAPVGGSQRGRDDVERRFQNPGGGRPILRSRDRSQRPLLLGLWESDPVSGMAVSQPVLVSADPIRRVGRTTRFSVFVSLASLQAAMSTGWSQEQNSVGEVVTCFAPPLLPLTYLADRDDVAPTSSAIRAAIDGAGLLVAAGTELPAAADRARRAGLALVRDARFSRRVLAAYGSRCAMCGLGVGLVQGAHIHPVAAPGSSDEPQNGLALCPNHHLAFDHHVLAVIARTRAIVFSGAFVQASGGDPAAKCLIETTFDRLAEPKRRDLRPPDSAFERRYRFYAEQYVWMERS